ncbi:uncharacterized protein LOC133708163 [Rosa rugosa]|uniref:uncharacterized protein LOC133708163 n=1 Tax=Rosa rugosa TaxID=74645 RepID=UPI002B40EA08|nr:uncharacterized protein LOC133708163 [Rosa rugosa]
MAYLCWLTILIFFLVVYILANDGIKYSSTLPVISWWDQIQMDLGFVGYEYPMRLGLSSEIFCSVITELDSHGFKVHGKVSETQVVFRVVNNKTVFKRKPGYSLRTILRCHGKK